MAVSEAVSRMFTFILVVSEIWILGPGKAFLDEPCELGEPASGAGMEKRHSLVSNFKQFGLKWYLCKIRIRLSTTSLYQFLVQWLHVNRLSGNEKTTFGRFMSLLGIIEGPIYLRVIISEIGREVMGCRLGGILWKWRKEEERCPAA